MEKANSKPEPIEQSVHVDCPPDEAFRLFTEHFAEWWPAAGERPMDLDDVLEWDPPYRVKFAWGPDQTVDVRFLEDAGGTRVTLTHVGWEQSGTPVCAARFSAFAQTQLFALA